MALDVISEFYKGGRLILPYIFVRKIGIIPTLILSEILAQFNYANKNKVDNYLGFIFDFVRTCKVLNIDKNLLFEQLQYLENLKFIEIYNILLPDSFYIRVYEDSIISFKKEEETKNFSNNWDDGLLASVNPIHKKVNFSESTIRIKHCFDINSRNPKTIPILYYLLLENLIKDYEQLYGDIFERYSDFDDFLYKYVSRDDSKDALYDFYWELKTLYINEKQRQNALTDEIPPDFDQQKG